jgi:hypothetical protein
MFDTNLMKVLIEANELNEEDQLMNVGSTFD